MPFFNLLLIINQTVISSATSFYEFLLGKQTVNQFHALGVKSLPSDTVTRFSSVS